MSEPVKLVIEVRDGSEPAKPPAPPVPEPTESGLPTESPVGTSSGTPPTVHVPDTLLSKFDSLLDHLSSKKEPSAPTLSTLPSPAGSLPQAAAPLGMPVLPAAALESAGGIPTPKPEPATFWTAKGSKYDLHEDDTTTRVKAARSDPGHEGDSGLKERSARTIYVEADKVSGLSSAGLNNLGSMGSRVVLEMEKGLASLVTWSQKLDQWGAAPSGRDIPFKTKPEVGLAPLELWKPTDDVGGEGTQAFRGMHAGNAITRIQTPGTIPSMPEAAGGIPPAPQPKETAPPVPREHIRLYHGGDLDGSNPSTLTPRQDEAESAAMRSGGIDYGSGGNMRYVDLPRTHPAFADSGTGAGGIDITPDIKAMLKAHPGPAAVAPTERAAAVAPTERAAAVAPTERAGGIPKIEPVGGGSVGGAATEGAVGAETGAEAGAVAGAEGGAAGGPAGSLIGAALGALVASAGSKGSGGKAATGGGADASSPIPVYIVGPSPLVSTAGGLPTGGPPAGSALEAPNPDVVPDWANKTSLDLSGAVAESPDAKKEEEEKQKSTLKWINRAGNVAEGAGQAGSALVNNETGSVLSTVSKGISEGLSWLGPEGAVAGAAIGALTKGFEAASSVITGFVDRGKELSSYNGALAATTARAEVNQLQQDMHEADRTGDDIAELTSLVAEIGGVFRELWLFIKEQVLGVINPVLKFIRTILEGILTIMSHFPNWLGGGIATRMLHELERIRGAMEGGAGPVEGWWHAAAAILPIPAH